MACMAAKERQLDLVTIGRSCIDLYGERKLAELLDMGSLSDSYALTHDGETAALAIL